MVMISLCFFLGRREPFQKLGGGERNGDEAEDGTPAKLAILRNRPGEWH